MIDIQRTCTGVVAMIGVGISTWSVPMVAAAQSLIPCSGNDCGTCELVALAQNVVAIIIILSVSIAVLVFMWAGYLMLSAAGSASQIQRGKQVMTDAVIGFVILLCGWLIVDVMLKSLLPGGTINTGTGPMTRK